MPNHTKKNRASKASVAANEDRFKALVAATSDVIYSLSADWRIMRELDGRGFLKDAHEPTADWQKTNIHPDHMEMARAAIEEAIQKKKMFELEHKVWRADGTPGWTISRAIPILDDQGEIVEWFGVASDITDRKMAEEALQESQELIGKQKRLYEAIISTTPDLAYIFNLDYTFAYANKALLTMWGKTWEEAIGKRLLENGYELWHAQMHEREIDQIRATRQPIRGEVSFPHAVLGRRIYDYILTPVINDKGEVEAVAGITRDITERKHWELKLETSSEELQVINEELAAANEEQAASNEELVTTNDELSNVNQQLLSTQQKLEESEKYFRYLADLVPAKISNTLPDGEVVFFNKQWLDYAGLSFEDLRNFGYQQMMHPDEIPVIQARLAEAAAKGVPLESEIRLKDINGNYRWHLNINSPILNDQGEITMWVASAVDIQRIKEEEQRKSDFIGMVSHELKTPLTSLTLMLQMLELKLQGSDDSFVPEALEKAAFQVKKMNVLINGFLNVSRLESAQIHINKTEFDLTKLIADTLEETRLTAPAHQLIFNGRQQALVYADKDKIGSVVSNLISNAVKYSPQQTSVTISCKLESGNVVVSVTDQGVGIKEQDAERIFERYYRIEDHRTKFISGFGIGLYLSAEIIRLHKGKIWVESIVGAGSTFYFSLPVDAEKA